MYPFNTRYTSSCLDYLHRRPFLSHLYHTLHVPRACTLPSCANLRRYKSLHPFPAGGGWVVTTRFDLFRTTFIHHYTAIEKIRDGGSIEEAEEAVESATRDNLARGQARAALQALLGL